MYIVKISLYIYIYIYIWLNRTVNQRITFLQAVNASWKLEISLKLSGCAETRGSFDGFFGASKLWFVNPHSCSPKPNVVASVGFQIRKQ